MLLKLWKLLFGGCEHEYETIKTINILNRENTNYAKGFEYHQRCKKCGKMRQYKFY